MALSAEELRSLWVSPDEIASKERRRHEQDLRRATIRLLATPWHELEPEERLEAVRLARRRGAELAPRLPAEPTPLAYTEWILQGAETPIVEHWSRLRPEEIALDVRACHFIDALIRRKGKWRGERPPRRAIALLDEMNAAEERYRTAQRALISFKAGTDGFPRNARPEDHEAFMGMIHAVRNDWHIRRMLFIASALYAGERGRESATG